MTHRNEFPAEYSLAGCSPAEPTSASSAVVILNQKPTRSPVFFSERQLFPNPAVSFHRAEPPRGGPQSVTDVSGPDIYFLAEGEGFAPRSESPC